MASIENLRLQLVNHDRQADTATLRVSYRAELSPTERAMPGLRYREEIKLRGKDELDPDDDLYTFSTAFFTAETDGIVNRSRTSPAISGDVLDEDDPLLFIDDGTDEVYAQVRLTPIVPKPTGDLGTSNTVERMF